MGLQADAMGSLLVGKSIVDMGQGSPPLSFAPRPAGVADPESDAAPCRRWRLTKRAETGSVSLVGLFSNMLHLADILSPAHHMALQIL